MTGVPDTLVEIRHDLPIEEAFQEARQAIEGLYPPGAERPEFDLREIVVKNGKYFVRLVSPAKDLHLLLQAQARAGGFKREVLCVGGLGDGSQESKVESLSGAENVVNY